MSSPEQNFRIVIEKIFNNWSNLRLAVEHGMGGRNGQQVAIQIMDYIYQYCIGNKGITQSELEDVVEDLMDQELNTLCDDNSIPEICQNLLRYLQMIEEGKYAVIEIELRKLPQGNDWLRPDVKIDISAQDDSSTDDDDDDSDSEMDVEMGDADNEGAGSSTVALPKAKKQQTEFVEPEPGWTTVRTKRK